MTSLIHDMGRRSYEEIGKPLPNKRTFVISGMKNFDNQNCLTAKSLPEAIILAGYRDVYISGSTRIYEEALPILEKIYTTEIDCEIKGDTCFP